MLRSTSNTVKANDFNVKVRTFSVEVNILYC